MSVRLDVGASAAAAINEHHRLAQRHAAAAVEHAIEAGRLLLQIKTQLMHGEWSDWLAAHVTVSPRQARRYMAVAAGKAHVRSIKKDTTVSVLPALPSPRRVWVQIEIPDLHGDLL